MTRLLFAVLLLLLAAPCGAASVRLVAEAPGRFRLEGEGLSGVAALDLTLSYDPATLALQRVAPGPLLAGVLFAGNPASAGQVRLTAVSQVPIAGSGVLAILEGSQPVAVTPRFLALQCRLHDAAGHSLPVQSLLPQASLIPDAGTSPETEVPVSQVSQGAAGSDVRGGFAGISRAEDIVVDTPGAQQEPEAFPPPSRGTETAVLAKAGTVPAEPAVATPSHTAPTVEKLFRGAEPLIAALERLPRPWRLGAVRAAIGQAGQGSGYWLSPPLALADGQAVVRVTVPHSFSAQRPAVAIEGGRLLAVRSAWPEGWLVEAVGYPGSGGAELLLLGDRELLRVPLPLVPPLILSAEWQGLAGDMELPAVDFDGDGRVTAADALLLVGNLPAVDEGQERHP